MKVGLVYGTSSSYRVNCVSAARMLKNREADLLFIATGMVEQDGDLIATIMLGHLSRLGVSTGDIVLIPKARNRDEEKDLFKEWAGRCFDTPELVEIDNPVSFL